MKTERVWYLRRYVNLGRVAELRETPGIKLNVSRLVRCRFQIGDCSFEHVELCLQTLTCRAAFFQLASVSLAFTRHVGELIGG